MNIKYKEYVTINLKEVRIQRKIQVKNYIQNT